MTWNIFSGCDICAVKLKFASLSHHQRLLFSQVYGYCNYGVFYSTGVPCKACECWLLQLNSVSYLATNSFTTEEPLNGKMQTNPHDPNDSKEPSNNQPHQYNCDCHECQIKYGSLPLLVQVIEGREKSSQEKNHQNTSQESDTSLLEPSTSYAGTSSAHKKTMTCPHCNKSFTHRGDFNKHVRKHTGEQPYACHVCERKFAHTSNLNRHLKVHSGDRPFVCNVCNKTFNRKDKLETHKKTKLCKKFGEKSDYYSDY